MKFVVVHQHDPTIPNVGGIGTFIDAFIRNAPATVDIDLIGVSAEAERFPVGRWHHISVGDKAVRFFPLTAANPVHVPLFPLTIRMLWALYRYRRHLDLEGAALEFHRIEYLLGFLHKQCPKVLFLHGHNMKDFYNKNTEVRWGKFPWLYFWLEKKLLPHTNLIHSVREDAVSDYQQVYPETADKISFVPTWVDERIFFSAKDTEREALRKQLSSKVNIPINAKIFLFVGRYEGQKDPLRLLSAFKLAKQQMPEAQLVLIGEGSLKAEMQNFVTQNALQSSVQFLPPMSQQDIAEWMNVADALCLSSAFEGMPCVILEALYCGLPVVSTAVGEAPRLIGDSLGGRLVFDDSAEAFAEEMLHIITQPPKRDSCKRQVTAFTADKVLAPIYQQHGALLAQ